MKKPQLWGLFLGVVLIGLNLYSAAQAATNPTNLPLVNVAIVLTSILWLAVGAFLIALYLRHRQNEDSNPNDAIITTSSIPNDPAALNKRRNWIFALVLTLQIIGSTSIWILNDYTVGLTLKNATIILDVIFNTIFFYVVIELIRGKRDVSKLLLYAIVLYAVEISILSGLREQWYTGFINIIFALYIVFALKSPPTKRNFRIAHMAILPVFFALAFASPFFDNGAIPDLSKKEALLEQQYINENSTLNGAYVLFLQKEHPAAQDIRYVQDGIEAKKARIVEIKDNLNTLITEHDKQLANVSQQKTIERLRYSLRTLNLYDKQVDKLAELMSYASTLDFNNLSETQISRLIQYKNEIDAFTNEVTEVQAEMNNANLN